MDKTFRKQLEESLYIHIPLRADESRMLEKRQLQKPVLKTQRLWNGENGAVWRTEGVGESEIRNGELCLKTTSRESFWQANEKQDGTYATFGDYTAYLDVSAYPSGEFSQFAFDIFPDCDGVHNPMVRVGYTNDGKRKIPDAYGREGFNAISLKNHEWNRCVWDISQLPHDCVKTLLFRIHKYGEDTAAGGNEKGSAMCFAIRNIRLEKIGTPNVTKGWQCEPGTIAYSTSGYFIQGEKTAILNPGGRDIRIFELLDASSGETAFEGPAERVVHPHGEFSVLDFTACKREGTYILRAGGIQTEPFEIGAHILESAVWRLINFLFCERCGYPVPGKHGVCHSDVLAHRDGRSLVFCGGWHDAADVSQQTVQTAEITDVLLDMAARVQELTLRARLMEEMRWGLDFVLRTSFGGGYHAANVIMRRWTDGIIGNFDDVNRVNVHRHAFDGFIYAATQAHAVLILRNEDAELAQTCLRAAKEDYQSAQTVFAEQGIIRPARSEHTLNASLSQHYAAAAVACARLYEATREEVYREAGAGWLDCLLACQDRGESGTGLGGFFYRDERRRTIVHFCHQAREHLFAQALAQGVNVLGETV